MAVLDAAQRATVLKDVLRSFVAANRTADLTSAELATAIAAVDDAYELGPPNTTDLRNVSHRNTIPEPAKSKLTDKEEWCLILEVTNQRFKAFT